MVDYAKVVSGFPGVGKTTLFQSSSRGLSLLDSDSTNFSWADATKKVRHPEWPANYIRHISQHLGAADAIFVSSHLEVRRALVEAGIEFYLVYPGLEMKEEYISRYRARGSDDAFVALLEKNYESWIGELSKQERCIHVVLQPGQHLSDVIGRILE